MIPRAKPSPSHPLPWWTISAPVSPPLSLSQPTTRPNAALRSGGEDPPLGINGGGIFRRRPEYPLPVCHRPIEQRHFWQRADIQPTIRAGRQAVELVAVGIWNCAERHNGAVT